MTTPRGALKTRKCCIGKLSNRGTLGATPRQWKAFNACQVEGLSQAKAAVLFGVSQQAISARIRRYREQTAGHYASALRRRGRKVTVRPIRLSFIENV